MLFAGKGRSVLKNHLILHITYPKRQNCDVKIVLFKLIYLKIFRRSEKVCSTKNKVLTQSGKKQRVLYNFPQGILIWTTLQVNLLFLFYLFHFILFYTRIPLILYVPIILSSWPLKCPIASFLECILVQLSFFICRVLQRALYLHLKGICSFHLWITVQGNFFLNLLSSRNSLLGPPINLSAI